MSLLAATGVGSAAVRRFLTVASVVGAALVLDAPEARGQGPAPSEGATAGTAIASDVTLEQQEEQTRVVVLLDRAAEIGERPGPARLVYRITGARAGGRRRPVVAPSDKGPVARVELVPAGRDLDVVIDLRREVAAKQNLVEVMDGFELRIDLGELSGHRPLVTSPPTHPAPPSPPAWAVPVAERPRTVKPSPPPPPQPPSVAPAPRQAPTADAPRTLSGHTFLTPVGGPSPFVTTHLALSLSFVDATFPRLDQRDGTRYDARLGALAQRLELGVRILPRLGIVLAGGGFVATGLDGQSAINLGADGGGTWLAGIDGVVARNESTGTQVSARISVEGSAGGQIEPIAALFLQTLATREVPPSPELFGPESSTLWRFVWSAAQAIGPHASAQAWLGWVAGHALDAYPGELDVDLTGGFALTADASPRVPIAILLEYDGDAILARSSAVATAPSAMLSDRGVSSFRGGLYYSGRRDLLLGVLGGTATRGAGPVRSSVEGRLELGYFF